MGAWPGDESTGYFYVLLICSSSDAQTLGYWGLGQHTKVRAKNDKAVCLLYLSGPLRGSIGEKFVLELCLLLSISRFVNAAVR